MKALILTVLAASAASAFADDGWVSVGAARSVAPAAPAESVDTSSQAVIAPSSRPVADSGSASSGLVSELYLQMEQMQQEIAMLRDQVEAQNHQITRMKQEQQDRYLDLDRRLSALMSADAPTTTASPDVAAVTLTPAEAYKQAQKLMYEKKYQEANDAYLAMAKQYPQEPLAVNATYWSGEIYLLQGELEKALSSFRSVAENHPDHQKVADASYKVGYTLDKLGKPADAKVWMKKVVDQFTGKADTAVRLAKNYLDSH